jgi:hypothetical protein
VKKTVSHTTTNFLDQTEVDRIEDNRQAPQILLKKNMNVLLLFKTFILYDIKEGTNYCLLYWSNS